MTSLLQIKYFYIQHRCLSDQSLLAKYFSWLWIWFTRRSAAYPRSVKRRLWRNTSYVMTTCATWIRWGQQTAICRSLLPFHQFGKRSLKSLIAFIFPITRMPDAKSNTTLISISVKNWTPWLSRFKKIVNSMSQTHHLFYVHRMAQRRNKYTGRCRQRGVNTLLPGINHKLEHSHWPAAWGYNLLWQCYNTMTMIPNVPISYPNMFGAPNVRFDVTAQC